MRIRYHLSPPVFARTDPHTGEPRKREYGAWMGRVFPLLARLRFLRGTAFDPFGHTAERRAERALAVHYASVIEDLCPRLTAQNQHLATEIAALAEDIRGFGHVRSKAAASVAEREAQLLAAFNGGEARPAAA